MTRGVSPAGKHSIPKRLAILAGIPAALALLAWWLEGNSVWMGTTIIAALLLGWNSLIGLKEWAMAIRREGLQPRLLLVLVYVWSVLGLFCLVGIWFATGTVHIDNYSQQAVKIELDGASWVDAPRGSTRQVRVRRGSHRIAVRAPEGDEPLQALTVAIEGRGVYVLNVLGAQTYHKGSVHYGGMRFSPGADDLENQDVKDAWLDVTKVDYLFQSPPDSIKVSVSKGMPASVVSEKRTCLTRISPLPAE